MEPRSTRTLHLGNNWKALIEIEKKRTGETFFSRNSELSECQNSQVALHEVKRKRNFGVIGNVRSNKQFIDVYEERF